MKQIALFSFFLFSLSFVAYAEYSVYSYDPSYTPYNLQAAIDHGNCDDELDKFDKSYQEVRERWTDYIDGTWANQYTGGGMTTSVFQRYEQRELDEINRAFITIDLESENEIAECL